MGALFTLRGAVVQRASRPILAVDSFSLNEGEHIALLGPNGSGKSTFIKLLTREVRPLYQKDAPVLFKGKDRFHRSDIKENLGIVSSSMQDEITLHMPVVDVVAGGLFSSLGIPANESEESATRARNISFDILASLGVKDLAERDIMTLSTGQARRVLIARALVHNPTTLILDEPCTGLDPEGMYYVRSTMRILAQAGKGIVLVTHYPEDIIPEIKRLLLIKQGEIFADGSKKELLTNEVMTNLFDVPLRVNRVISYKKDFSQESARNKRDSQNIGSFNTTNEGEDEYFSLVSAY